MLATTVEVWPGGDIRRRRVIHTISLVNETELTAWSDYSLHIDGVQYEMVKDHERAKGALVLLERALIIARTTG